MEKWKKEYEEIKVPEDLKEKMEEFIMKAKQQKRRAKKIRLYKTFGSMAAVMAIVLILPNTSATAAAAMQQLPILGDFFKVVTVREYQLDGDRNMADVKVPEVVADENADAGDEAVQEAKQSAESINFDIQEETDKVINEFKKNLEEYGDETYQDLMIDSKVLTNDDKWFSLELLIYQGAGSGYEQHRHYTIDKTTGKRVSLKDICGDDYVETISEQVKQQMRERMAADENVYYWVDDEDIPEINFQQIREDQDFYVNGDGKVVVCFDEYEVAPGYMGCVEFTIE